MTGASNDGKGGGPKRGFGKGTIIGMPQKSPEDPGAASRTGVAAGSNAGRAPADGIGKPLLKGNPVVAPKVVPPAPAVLPGGSKPKGSTTLDRQRAVTGAGATSQALRALTEVTPKLELDPRSEDSIMRKNPLVRADRALHSALDEALGEGATGGIPLPGGAALGGAALGGAALGGAALGGAALGATASLDTPSDAPAEDAEATVAAAASARDRAAAVRSTPAPAMRPVTGPNIGTLKTPAAKRGSITNPYLRGLIMGMGLTSLLVAVGALGFFFGRAQGAPLADSPSLKPAPARAVRRTAPPKAATPEQAPTPNPAAAPATPNPPAADATTATAPANAATAAPNAPTENAPTENAAPPTTAAPTNAAAAAPSPAPASAPRAAAPTAAAPAAPAPPTPAAPAAAPAPAPSTPAAPAPNDPPAPTTTADLPTPSDAIKAMDKDAREAEAKKRRSKASKALRAGNPAEAEALLREALAYDAGSASLAQDLAETLLAAKRAEDAYPWAVRATTLAPRSAGTYVTLGDAESALGRNAAADAAWRRALALDAGNAAAKARLAR